MGVAPEVPDYVGPPGGVPPPLNPMQMMGPPFIGPPTGQNFEAMVANLIAQVLPAAIQSAVAASGTFHASQIQGGHVQGPNVPISPVLSATHHPGHMHHHPHGSYHPPSVSGSAPRYQCPRLTTKDIQELLERPELLKLKLGQILVYVLAVSLSGGGLRYPDGILNFIADPAALSYLNTYFEHWLLSGQDFNRDDLIQHFRIFVSGEVRPPSVIALQELMSGSIRQSTSESAAKYSERFLQRSRILPNESQSSLCHHFLSGLSPSLRQLCCLDRNNNRWEHLLDLIRFTYAEEERYNLCHSDRVPCVAPRTRQGDEKWHVQGPGKRTKYSAAVAQGMDVDGGSVAAAIVRSGPSGSGPSGSGPSGGGGGRGSGSVGRGTAAGRGSAPRPSGGGGGTSGSGPSGSGGAPLKQPMTDCPFFGLNNLEQYQRGLRPDVALTPFEKTSLSDYGLCWFCKRSTSHSSRECPEKQQKQ
jgi:hypothetical protein